MPELLTGFLEILLFNLGGLYQGLRLDWNLVESSAPAAFVIWRLDPLVGPIERWAARVARRRWRMCFAFVIGAVLLRAALLPIMPVPKPVVADEFSHLLLADTLLHGRVSNPVHPFWEHFESLHVLVQPVYVSNYFPGQGAALAAALWATGSAWIGVLAMSGVCAGVFCWAMLGWMPARWAALGTLIAVLRFGIGSYWINGYHGGFLAAIGGALVAGSYPRLRRSWLYAAIAGVGFVLLLYSRPYEGFAFAAVFFCTASFISRGVSFSSRRASALPYSAVLRLATSLFVTGTGVLGLAAYFHSITGSATKTPYTLSQARYGWPMAFAWSRAPADPIEHRNPELRAYYDYEREERAKVDTPAHFLQHLTIRVQEYWRFYYGPTLSACLIGVAWVFRRRRFRPLLWSIAATSAAVMLEGAASPHYLAPAAMPLMALVPLSIRRLRRTRPWGSAFSRFAVATLVLVLAGRMTAQALHLPYTQRNNFQSWCCKTPGRLDKYALAAYLESQPGSHLVLVTPKSDPYDFFQWIYNAADIDGSRIVWARDLGPDKNRALLDHYRDRSAWRVDPNVEPATLERLR